MDVNLMCKGEKSVTTIQWVCIFPKKSDFVSLFVGRTYYIFHKYFSKLL